ncbi:hydrogen peroxide-inducible genes activator [Ponticaulis sp.]|uniref:hydrogen peroxide-inducible genes activator n=1 Tax=Ponticaulis sp. TaxID=2020902 RepID=UPI000C6AC3F8|nr:hydrogen peroxide-inducible genes activator [Ponticaulis sp.]MAJ07314.1 LysR family transcriptional regulator [Ponticaulis sp.]
MRPTLKQLEYLVAIAETGKYGEAAKRVNVSQSSLSTQIADMEEELGTRLLERGRHGAVLTPTGRDIVVRARYILRQVEELHTLSRQSEEDFKGRINLGVLPSVGPYLLPPATRQLHQRFPELRLIVREERTIDLAEHLRDGRFDLIISTPESHPECRSEPLFTEQLWICAASDDPLSSTTGPVEPEELRGHPLLTIGYGHRLSELVHRLADDIGTQVSTEYEGSSLDAVRQMAIMGAGVAVLPSLYALSEARRDPDQIIRRINYPSAEREIALCWRASSPLTNRYRMLADELSQTASSILEQGAASIGAA